MNSIIHFRSIDKSQVDAWQRVFGKEKGFEISHGDFFADDFPLAKFDAMVSPANSFGFMGGGIDLPIRQHYEGIQQRVQDMIKERHCGELIVGMSDVVETYGYPPLLIVTPTVRTSNDAAAETVNAYLAFKGLLVWLKENPVRRILVPGFCSGVAGMPHYRSAMQMMMAWKAFRGEKIPNTVCVLSVYDQKGEDGMRLNDRTMKTLK